MPHLVLYRLECLEEDRRGIFLKLLYDDANGEVAASGAFSAILVDGQTAEEGNPSAMKSDLEECPHLAPLY